MDRRNSTTSSRLNAVLAWGAAGLLFVLAGWFALAGSFLWSAGAVVVALTALVPAFVLRDWRATPPWGLPALSTLPFLLEPSPPLTSVSAYLAVAAVALSLAIYLSAFTSVELTMHLGILIVVTTTMAVGTVWAGARGLADLYLGFSFLDGLNALERDLLLSAVGGLLASVVFEGYFRERTHGGLHGVPMEEA